MEKKEKKAEWEIDMFNFLVGFIVVNIVVGCIYFWWRAIQFLPTYN